MAPQTNIPLAANVLGTIGTVFWCIQLVPQVWTNWRTKKTEGLPGLMMFLWAACAVPFGIYDIVQNFAIALQIQPQIFCAFSLISWAQVLIYNNGWSARKATALASGIGALFAGIQVVLILTLRGPYEAGVAWPMLLIGIIAAILLTAGLLPPYREIWKRKGRVVGINFWFIAMDWLGAFLSLMAVVAQETFDALGGVLYIVVIALELGIFLSHFIWLIRTRKLRARARREGIKFDDLPEAKKYQWSRSTVPASTNSESSDIKRSAVVTGVPPDLEAGGVADLPEEPQAGILRPISIDAESTPDFSKDLKPDLTAVVGKNEVK